MSYLMQVQQLQSLSAIFNIVAPAVKEARQYKAMTDAIAHLLNQAEADMPTRLKNYAFLQKTAQTLDLFPAKPIDPSTTPVDVAREKLLELEANIRIKHSLMQKTENTDISQKTAHILHETARSLRQLRQSL